MTTGPTVVFLGDSITAGLGIDPNQAYPAILQRQLETEKLVFRLVNAGVSGDTTAGGRTRIAWLLRQNPDVLVVQLGGNDALRGQPLKSMEKNLGQIIEKAKALPCEVLLLGMRIPPSYGASYSEGFAAMYDHLAASYEVAHVSFFMKGVGGVGALNLPAGIHPNAEGHAVLARTVLPELRSLLQTVAAGSK